MDQTLSQSQNVASSAKSLEENAQRVFYTRRDPRRVRVLKFLHVIPRTPSSVTYAQLGVQADLPPYSAQEIIDLRIALQDALSSSEEHFQKFNKNQTILSDIENELQGLREQVHGMNNAFDIKEQNTVELREQLSRSEVEVGKLIYDHRAAALEAAEKKIQLTQAKTELQQLEIENIKLRSQVEELLLEVERLEVDVAFLLEEKGDLETSLNEHKSFLDIVTKEKDQSSSREEELKSTLLQTKIESAEQVGKYIDELNEAHEEKRKMLSKKLSGSSRNIQRVLTTTENYLKLKEEKNRLVDQVELLSTQTVFQDLLLEKYHGQLFRLTKLLGEEQKSMGDERSLLKGEITKATELIKNKPLTNSFSPKQHSKKRGYSPQPRNCSSLPGSPLRSSKHLGHSEPHFPIASARHSRRDLEKTKDHDDGKEKNREKPRRKSHGSPTDERFYTPRESSPRDLDEEVLSKSPSRPRSRTWDAWKKTVPGKLSKSSVSHRKPLLH